MQRRSIVPVFFGLLLLFGCSLSGQQGINIFSYVVEFKDGQQGWTGDFTGYPASEQDSIEYLLQFAYTDLPANLGSSKGIMMSGHNHNDSLFMFIKKKITGLYPDTEYAMAFEVEFASNAPTGAIGVNGAPGESVLLKAGASAPEPKKIVEGNNCELNIDKGNQTIQGEDMIILGDIAVDANTTDFTLITRNNSANYTIAPFTARTNSRGEVWLIIGTDSGYKGLTTVYYTRVNAILSVSNN
jgi:hypothetical protein